MNTEDRTAAFEKLGYYLNAIDGAEFDDIVQKTRNENSWYTEDSIKLALNGVKNYLDQKNLNQWVSSYNLTNVKQKIVAVVMAGNIPLAGFHDFLSVLISGHAIQVKLSSKDSVLLKYLTQKLIEIDPRFESKITFAERLKNFDAVIATGSDNTARYFHYYFGKYPNVIRKNRTSCAVLSGDESAAELKLLGNDVFSYFGLGCRNVSKIFIPEGYDLSTLFKQWESFQEILNHHKYHNNYDYQKSIFLVNTIPFLDTGFVIFHQSEKLVSPISVVYYETYNNEGELALKLLESKDKIQCVVGNLTTGAVPFGQAQSPMLWDYADQVDTLKFLTNLN